MLYEKLLEVVDELYNSTSRDEVEWKKTDEYNVFQASFPASSIRIEARKNPGEPQTDYYLTIYNENGELIEEVDSQETTLINDDNEEVLKLIFDKARRRAMGVENALNDILAELRKQ